MGVRPGAIAAGGGKTLDDLFDMLNSANEVENTFGANEPR